ncbi:MAG: bacterial transcriptional activator domain-containing protein, partial [Anaerolineae bacterium]|nr:bacterial transcriptional activator domain-containing protein [Anaerolineae bacterium]
HRARLLLAGKAGGEGAKAVRIDRQGLARLDRSLVVSDVHSFLTLIAQANKGDWVEAKAALEKAVALYRADLLSAPGVPTYPWVDQRGDNGLTLRETYHLEYMAAVKRLARLYREDGDAQLAVPLLRGLLQQEPLLEDVVRELYRCYEQLGDLGALLREDRRLRHALYTAYYDPHNPDDDPGLYPPEAETVAAFEEVRRALDKMKEFDAG